MSKELFKKIIKFVSVVVITLIGSFGTGYILGKVLKGSGMELSKIEFPAIDLLGIWPLLFCLGLSFFIQIIIHEAGHLVFGLLTGFKFVSFRVGSLTFIREDGRLKLKKYKIVGTGGQCLLMPKNEEDEKSSYALYNFGGIISGAIITVIVVILLSLFHSNGYINMFFISMIITGILVIVTNGIPIKIGGVANDGYNAFSLKKDKVARHSFYLQMKVNGLLYEGKRMRDMPLDWFRVDEGVDYNNPIVAGIKGMEAGYYHDKMDFETAREIYIDLLKKSPKLLGLYKNEINCELLFYEIVSQRREEKIKELYTKELQKYIKATDCYITRKRLMYAYSLLVEKDIEKANRILEEFEKVKKTYPNKGEIECEVEVVELVKKMAETETLEIEKNIAE